MGRRMRGKFAELITGHRSTHRFRQLRSKRSAVNGNNGKTGERFAKAAERDDGWQYRKAERR